jgi:hypothetical protein
MATSLFIATTIGLFIATQNHGHWSVTGQALNDQPLTSLAISEEVVLAGSTDGHLRSKPRGRTQHELLDRQGGVRKTAVVILNSWKRIF